MMVMNDHELCFFWGFFFLLHCTTGFGIWYLVIGLMDIFQFHSDIQFCPHAYFIISWVDCI